MMDLEAVTRHLDAIRSGEATDIHEHLSPALRRFRFVPPVALGLLASSNYFLSLAVKMGIIFSLAPINRGIERHLLKRVTTKRREGAAAAGGAVVPVAE